MSRKAAIPGHGVPGVDASLGPAGGAVTDASRHMSFFSFRSVQALEASCITESWFVRSVPQP